MFKMVKHLKKLEWPVEVNVPADGGKAEKIKFTAFFKILQAEEYEAALTKSKNDFEFIKHFLVDWADLPDEKNKEIEFSDETLKEFCQYPFARQAIIKAYNDASQGFAAKN